MKRNIATIALLFVSSTIFAEKFEFVATGDTAYQGEPSIEAYARLIELINEQDNAFSIHVGDIWGASMCVEERYEEILDTFNSYLKPVVFTPGDNEWTDCDRHVYGDWEPADRLQMLRGVYYKEAKSLGTETIPLVRQADVSPYTKFVENVRWLHNDVLFLTLNVPGSNNNVDITVKSDLLEAYERNQANKAWIRDSFRIATEQDLPAVVIAIQAELFANTGGQRVPPAYADLVNEMRIATSRYSKPILLVHGDAHRFTIDRPFSAFGPGRLINGNFMRLQVYGDPEVRAVRVTVDPATPWVFGFEPLYLQ